MTNNGFTTNEAANWFVLRVKPNHEKRVSELIGMLGYDAFLPVYRVRRKWGRRWQDVDDPLFPRYVFCRFQRRDWVPIINTPGVVNAVRSGKLLAPVEQQEIEALQVAQRAKVAMQPWPYMKAGDTLKINAGPLAGLTGLLVDVKQQNRLVLSVTLLQRSVLVEIDHDWVHVVSRASLYLPGAQVCSVTGA